MSRFHCLITQSVIIQFLHVFIGYFHCENNSNEGTLGIDIILKQANGHIMTQIKKDGIISTYPTKK